MSLHKTTSRKYCYRIINRHSNKILALAVTGLIRSHQALEDLQKRLQNPEVSDYMRATINREMTAIKRELAIHKKTIHFAQK